MSKITQAKKIINLLEKNSNERFSARDIAEKIVSMYPEDMKKRKIIQDLKMKNLLYLRLLQR